MSDCGDGKSAGGLEVVHGVECDISWATVVSQNEEKVVQDICKNSDDS